MGSNHESLSPSPGRQLRGLNGLAHCAAEVAIPKGWFFTSLQSVCTGPVEGVTGPVHFAAAEAVAPADPACGLAGCPGDAARGAREEGAKHVPQEEQGDDDGDSEEAEQDCVLGRRLAILPLPQLMHRDLHRDDRSQQDVGHGVSSGRRGARPLRV